VRRICRWQRDGGDDPAPRSAGVSKKQSPFAGSDRQIRGRLLATLREKSVGFAALCVAAQSDDVERIRRCLDGLESDGLVVKRGRTWALAGESR
jgi:A/G-specific adenine glycosylase